MFHKRICEHPVWFDWTSKIELTIFCLFIAVKNLKLFVYVKE